MSDYPMLISNKLHSFRNFRMQISSKYVMKSLASIISLLIFAISIEPLFLMIE